MTEIATATPFPEDRDPPPLEETDPELARLIGWFVQNRPALAKWKGAEQIWLDERGVELLVSGKLIREVDTRGKTKRNDPCPCGSSKKYKKCCGRGR